MFLYHSHVVASGSTTHSNQHSLCQYTMSKTKANQDLPIFPWDSCTKPGVLELAPHTLTSTYINFFLGGSSHTMMSSLHVESPGPKHCFTFQCKKIKDLFPAHPCPRSQHVLCLTWFKFPSIQLLSKKRSKKSLWEGSACQSITLVSQLIGSKHDGDTGYIQRFFFSPLSWA